MNLRLMNRHLFDRFVEYVGTVLPIVRDVGHMSRLGSRRFRVTLERRQCCWDALPGRRIAKTEPGCEQR